MAAPKRDIAYYRNKLLALRNAMDETLAEMETAMSSVPQRTAQRRNLKESRVIDIDQSYASGTWRKPAAAKKG